MDQQIVYLGEPLTTNTVERHFMTYKKLHENCESQDIQSNPVLKVTLMMLIILEKILEYQ